MRTRTLLVLAVGLGIFTLTGCASTTEAWIATVASMVDAGTITPEAGEEMVTAFLAWSKQAQADGWLTTLLVGVTTVVGTYFGVNLFPGKKIKNPGA